jgi:hypothetical protein
MIPEIARRVETQQADSLAAVSQFIGFRFNRCRVATFFPGNPDARKNLELLDVDPIGEQIRLVASVKITALPIRARCRRSNREWIYGLILILQPS